MLTPDEYRTGVERIAADIKQKVAAAKNMLRLRTDDTTDLHVILGEIETDADRLLNQPIA